MKRLVVTLLLLLASPAWADSAYEQFVRGLDAYSRGDHATALKELRPLAEQGNARAQLILDVIYEEQFQRGADAYNRGDHATTLKELRPLAEQGDADAQYNLGHMYDKGQAIFYGST